MDDCEIGVDVLPWAVGGDWAAFCASSELIIPGEGRLANLPVVGIAPIGWAFVTTTSLLIFLEVLRLRCSIPFEFEGAALIAGAEGAGGELIREIEGTDVTELDGAMVGAGFGSTC